MDVLFVISHLGHGGAQKVIIDLANKWTDSGLLTGIVTATDDFSNQKKLNKNVDVTNIMPVVIANMPTKLVATYNIYNYCKKLRRIIKEKKPKYIISFICPTNIKAIIANIGINNSRLIISERNNINAQKFPLYIEAARKLLYKYADLVTANSKMSVEAMKNFVPETKVFYVENPVTMPDTSKKIKSDSVHRIIYCGRLVKQKRVGLVLEAVNLLVKKGMPCLFDIVGDGPLALSFKEYCANEKILTSVNFHGYIEDVSSCYENADIFVLCSEYEGVSNALLEAMSYGLVCIVSREANSSSDIIIDGYNGIVIDNANSNNLASCIENICSDPEVIQYLGNNAIVTARQYDDTSVFNKWNSLLDRV